MNRIASILILSFAGLAADVTAAPITFHFQGVVEFVQGPLADELLGPGISAADLIGTPFHGSYTFNPDAIDANGSSAIGQYSHVGSPYGMEFHFAHRSFFFDDLDMGIFQDFDLADLGPFVDDVYAVQTPEHPHPTDPLLLYRGRLDLIANGTELVGPVTALVGDDIPLLPPDIHTFDLQRVFVNVLRLEDDNGRLVSRVRGGIGGTLQVLSVPEPGLTLLALGFGALLFRSRRAR